jgi:AcrR family transcriptional regulator
VQRKTSPPVDTRAELVEAARRLFAREGYDATSVQAIIDAVGVSKGSFYHYFESKESVLDSVVETMTRQALDQVAPLVADATLSAVDKLNRFMAAMRCWRLAHMPLVRETLRVLMRDENAIIHHKIHQRSAQLTRPLLAQILAQGVREGVFRISDVEETASLVQHISDYLGDKNARLLLEDPEDARRSEEVGRRVNLGIEAIERILGAKPGSLELQDGASLDSFLRGLGPIG